MLSEVTKKYFLLCNQAQKPPKITQDDIAICCPLCKEGKSWNKKQRCHLYFDKKLKKELVKCFNCGFTARPAKFFKEVSPEIYAKYQTEMRSSYLNELKEKNPTIVKEIKEEVQPLYIQLKPSQEKQILYLKSRGLEKFKNLFFTSDKDFEYKDKTIPIKDSIIAPLYNEKNVLYGFQARKIDEKRFYTIINGTSGYKIWNLNGVKSKYIFVFESIFDALSSGLPLSNIVAGLGIDIPKDRFKNKKVIYCLDNQNVDETSRKKTLKLLKNSYCFIWPKYYNGEKITQKDFNELLQSGFSLDEIKHLILSNIYSPNDIKAEILLKIS